MCFVYVLPFSAELSSLLFVSFLVEFADCSHGVCSSKLILTAAQSASNFENIWILLMIVMRFISVISTSYVYE